MQSLDAEPYRDPFELFTAEDLIVNPKWNLPQNDKNVRTIANTGSV